MRYINGDTREMSTLDLPEFNLIFHLGEYSRVENSLDVIDHVLDNNIEGTLEVLKLARKHRAKIIYAGSSTKFGDDGAAVSQTPYSFSKYVNTELVVNYCAWNDLDFCIAYFYNVYGPGEIDHGHFATVVGIFQRCFMSGKPLPVVSPGTQRRNFTHVSDIVDGLCRLVDAPSGDGYGIGSDDAVSILELAEMFGTDTVMLPERQGNRQNSELVADKMKALGWSSSHSLKDYIEAMISGRRAG